MTTQPLTPQEREEIRESHAWLRVARTMRQAKGIDLAPAWDGRAVTLPGEEPETFEPQPARALLPAVTPAELRQQWELARAGMHRGGSYEHPWSQQAALDPRLRGLPVLWFQARDPDAAYSILPMRVTPCGPAPWQIAACADLAWFDPP